MLSQLILISYLFLKLFSDTIGYFVSHCCGVHFLRLIFRPSLTPDSFLCFPTRTILLGSLSLGIFIKYCTVFPPFWYFCSQRTASLCIVPSYTLRWRFMFIFTEENDVPPVRLEDCWYQYLSTRSICSIFTCVGDAYSPASLCRQFVS